MTHNAFVYRWRNTRTREWYVGYHVGTEHDGYICSSHTALPRILRERDQWSRKILRWGTKQQMLALEMSILTRLNAKDNKHSLNRSTGYPPGTYYGTRIQVHVVKALSASGVRVWPKFNQALRRISGLDYYGHVCVTFFTAIKHNDIPTVKRYIPIMEQVFGVVLAYDLVKITEQT